MAIVQRVSAPSVGIERIPDAQVRTRLDPGHADGLVRGVMAIGGAAAQIAQREEEKANAAAILEAQRKLGDWERAWFDPNNPEGVNARKGRDALGLVDVIDPDFDRVQAELAGGIRDERTRTAFLTYATGRREQILDRVNGYATREHDAYVDAEFKAGVANAAELAARAGLEGRWDEMGQLANTGIDTIRRQAAINGQPPEATQVQERAFLDAVHTTTVNGFLARGQTMEAATYLHDNADGMSAPAVAEVTARLRPMMLDAAAYALLDGLDAGVDPVALGTDVSVAQVWGALERQESGGNQAAVSAVGAVGVAQIMPSTGPIAAQYAGVPFDPDRLKNDAAYNRQLGQAYLQAQVTTFGAMPLALAAYNAGPGRVDQWIQRYGDPRTGAISMEDFVARIPFKETREYVQTIMGRVGGGGGSGGQPASVPPATGTLEDQLARLRAVQDPELRQRLEAGVRQRFNDRKVAEQEQELAAQRAIYGTVNSMDPSGDWRKLLPPDQRAYADQHNLSGALDEIIQRRRTGVPAATAPHVQLALSEVVRQASLGNPAAAAEIMNLRPYDPKLSWSDADRAMIAKVQVALRAGDGTTLAAAASDAEITGTIAQFRRQNLGIPDTALKGNGESAQQAASFEQAMRLWVSDFSAANGGRKPSYRELQAKADELTFATPTLIPRRVWWDSVEPRPAMQVTSIDQIPQQYRQQLRDSFKGETPTDEQLLERYLLAARKGLLQ